MPIVKTTTHGSGRIRYSELVRGDLIMGDCIFEDLTLKNTSADALDVEKYTLLSFDDGGGNQAVVPFDSTQNANSGFKITGILMEDISALAAGASVKVPVLINGTVNGSYLNLSNDNDTLATLVPEDGSFSVKMAMHRVGIHVKEAVDESKGNYKS